MWKITEEVTGLGSSSGEMGAYMSADFVMDVMYPEVRWSLFLGNLMVPKTLTLPPLCLTGGIKHQCSFLGGNMGDLYRGKRGLEERSLALCSTQWTALEWGMGNGGNLIYEPYTHHMI